MSVRGSILATGVAAASLIGSSAGANEDFNYRYAVQLRLKQDGFYTSTVDGRFGSGTRAAIKAYADQAGIEADERTVVDHMVRSSVEAHLTLTDGMVLAATNRLKDGLKDPYSAVIEVEHAYMQTGGAAVCGTVNAKNEYGAYVGKQTFQVMLFPAFGLDPPFTGLFVRFGDEGADWECLLGTSVLAGR